jgi:hypothetical protein
MEQKWYNLGGYIVRLSGCSAARSTPTGPRRNEDRVADADMGFPFNHHRLATS